MKIASILSVFALFATQASCTIMGKYYSGIKLANQQQRETRAEVANLPKGNVQATVQKLESRNKGGR